VKKHRLAKNMTLRELGKATGIFFLRLSQIEHGVAVPKSDEIERIKAVLGENLIFPEDDPEEAERRRKGHEARLLATAEAIVSFKESGKYQGVIKCPVCGNDLNWGMSPGNKHTCGECKTEGCLVWVE